MIKVSGWSQYIAKGEKQGMDQLTVYKTLYKMKLRIRIMKQYETKAYDTAYHEKKMKYKTSNLSDKFQLE